jgi:hypothetical protein
MPLADAGERNGERSFKAAPPSIIDANKTYVATVKTAKGDIVVELDTKRTITTNNFVYLAAKGYYDGLNFHRVEPGFVIQGGCPRGTGTGGPGYQIPGEFEGSNFKKGVIGMARRPSSAAASSASQSAARTARWAVRRLRPRHLRPGRRGRIAVSDGSIRSRLRGGRQLTPPEPVEGAHLIVSFGPRRGSRRAGSG